MIMTHFQVTATLGRKSVKNECSRLLAHESFTLEHIDLLHVDAAQNICPAAPDNE